MSWCYSRLGNPVKGLEIRLPQAIALVTLLRTIFGDDVMRCEAKRRAIMHKPLW